MSIGALTFAIATPTHSAATAIVDQRTGVDSASTAIDEQASVPRIVFNPRTHFDTSAGMFVMEYRSAETGDVERQVPDEHQLRAYAAAKKLNAKEDAAKLDAGAGETAGASGDAASAVRIQV